jgi:hypothetical protein
VRTTQLEPWASWWLGGNVTFGGLIGIIIDLATGSGLTVSPGDVHMDMATAQVGRVQLPEPKATAHWGDRESRRLHNAGPASKYRDHCVKQPGYSDYQR